MLFRQFLLQFVYLTLTLTRMSSGQSAEEEDHVNNRLTHYIKRLEVVTQKTDKYPTEIQELKNRFMTALAEAPFKEKSELLLKYTENLELEDFLEMEFDKQLINEDIGTAIWYLNEVMADLEPDLHDEAEMVIKVLQEIYRVDDMNTKLSNYSDMGEALSEKFLDYFYGDSDSVPLMNAQLKYYQEFLEYLLQEKQLNQEFEKNAQELLRRVEAARLSDAKAAKETELDYFDNLSTKFGRYIDEHHTDFKIHKFGE